MEDIQHFKMYLKRFKQRHLINWRGLFPSLDLLSVIIRQLLFKRTALKGFTNSTNITYPLSARSNSIWNIFQEIKRNFLETPFSRARANASIFRQSYVTSRRLSVLLSSKKLLAWTATFQTYTRTMDPK